MKPVNLRYMQRAGFSMYKLAYVNGEWVDCHKKFPVYNPANDELLADVPDMGESEVQKAIDAAKEAFEQWSQTTAKERGIALRKWFKELEGNKQALAEIMTKESGKPIGESLGEVAYANSFVDWFAEEGRRTYGEIVPSPVKSKELLMVREPLGVVGLITPWNFPMAMITRKASPALAAGCTCIIKPAEDTPLTALALAALAQEAGIPKGVFNVVTSSRSNANSVGKLLCTSPHVAGISFTGSTHVGKILYSHCAQGIKRISLELGGNAPFIVYSNANLDKAVTGALAAKFRNCGQACVAANRFLIQEDVFDQFVELLKTNITKSFHQGDASKNEKCNLGPLINLAQVEKVNSIVKDAISKGAKVALGGGKVPSLGDKFFAPTILTNVTPEMLCYTEEVFGPVAVCIKFKTEEESLSIANNSSTGLAGYFYTNDISQAWRVAKKMQVGMVGINEGIISHTEAAFGGVKESGIGREGSRHGMDEFTQIKYMCFGNLE
uniref:Succinate-semialdehyde dehydrogenase, mitochondrial n=1 Tax=Cacopsylla melanoneura TaxID=428564 RepID=A0A8D8PSS4_9HEMI